MTVTSETYIDSIVPRASSNEEWLLSFPIRSANELYVWTESVSTGVLTRQTRGQDYVVRIGDDDSAYLVWKGTSPHGDTTHIRAQRHMMGLQASEYITSYSNLTPTGFQSGIDEIVQLVLQTMREDLLERKHWSTAGERLTDVADGVSDDDATTKSQVDTAIGGGTSPFVVASADVGQWATANSSGTYSWEPFSGTADPKGQEYKYLTGTGWVDIDLFSTITGTKALGKLVMEVDGRASWNTVTEWSELGTANKNVAVGRAMGIHRYDSTDTFGYLDYRTAPDLLPNEMGNRLTAIETGYDSAIGLKNEYSKQLKTTEHTVSCLRKPSTEPVYRGYSGIGAELTGECDHPVYVGSFTNPFSDADIRPFLTPHKVSTLESYLDFSSATPLEHGDFFFSYVMNLISITSSTITFAAAALLHERYEYIPGATNLRIITLPDEMDITFNALWFKQKA